jgi:predicted AAA+ superfamily ATPase
MTCSSFHFTVNANVSFFLTETENKKLLEENTDEVVEGISVNNILLIKTPKE